MSKLKVAQCMLYLHVSAFLVGSLVGLVSVIGSPKAIIVDMKFIKLTEL